MKKYSEYRVEGVRGHNAKLRRLTRHYGAANPGQYRTARVNEFKSSGPEEDVGYGADSAAQTARKDRPAKRMGPGNATATYRNGGRVANRQAGGSISSKPARKAKGKGKTNISINIMPPATNPPAGVSGLPMGANPALPPRPPVPPPAMPPRPPMGGAPGMPPRGAGPLGQMAMANQAGALLPRKRGGRVKGRQVGGGMNPAPAMSGRAAPPMPRQAVPMMNRRHGGKAAKKRQVGGGASQQQVEKLMQQNQQAAQKNQQQQNQRMNQAAQSMKGIMGNKPMMPSPKPTTTPGQPLNITPNLRRGGAMKSANPYANRRHGGHSDAAADARLIRGMVKDEALKHVERANGGPVRVGLKAGAMSGEGRLTRNRHMDHKLKPTTDVTG